MNFLFWVKNLLIFRALYWVVRNLWWVFIIIIFWPAISDYLENFKFYWELKWAFYDFMRNLQSWQLWHWLVNVFRSIVRFFIGLFYTIKDAIQNSSITLEGAMREVGGKASEIIKNI